MKVDEILSHRRAVQHPNNRGPERGVECGSILLTKDLIAFPN